jgi:hypothetical protein
MTMSVRLDMITHSVVLLYAIYFSFKHMMTSNEKFFKKTFAFIVFISSLWLIAHRDTYLPFLGYAAIPPSVFKDTLVSSNANVEVSLPIEAKDGTRVIYWGAKSNAEIQQNPKDAYADYSNAGVTTIQDGIAKIRFHCPSQYKVGPGYTLKRHIHYRTILENGLVTPIETKYVKC